MKNRGIFIGLIGLVILTGLIALIPMGCGNNSDSGGGAISGGGGGSTTSTYTASGKITDAVTGNAIPNANVNLADSSRGSKYSNSTTSDSSGNYTFTGIPAGNYTLTCSTNGYVTLNDNFAINSSISTMTQHIINKNDWNTMMGDANHPYDASYGYIYVLAMTATSTAASGYSINLSPTTYSSRAYLSNGVCNWTATSAYTSGDAFFYKTVPGTSYTGTASIPGGTTITGSGFTCKAGEMSSYILQPQVATPTPSCTTTAQPTGQPTTCVR